MRIRRGRTGLFGRRSGLLRRLGWLSIASAVWSNRRDVKRWVDFGRRAVQERDRRPMADLVTEAKVRAAVSRDPLLRRDASLEDLRVDDGVVTMLTNTAGWPDPRDQIVKLKQVKGITDVTSQPAPVEPPRDRPSRPTRSPFTRLPGRFPADTGAPAPVGSHVGSPGATAGSTAGSAAASRVAAGAVAADAPAGAAPDRSSTGGR